MRKNLNILYFALSATLTSSCTFVSVSPMVTIKNSSTNGEIVKNIKINWNGYNLLETLGPINVCDGGGSQDFGIKRESDIFGLVNVEWQNSMGQKIVQRFTFDRNDFPGYKNNSSSIYLFFTQANVEYYTSDHPNFHEIQRQKQGNWVYKWFEDEYTHKCVNDPEEASRMRAKAKKYSPISTKTGKPIID